MNRFLMHDNIQKSNHKSTQGSVQTDKKVSKSLKIAYLSIENLAKFDREASGPARSFKKSKRDNKA